MIGFMCFVLHRIFDRCVRKSGNGELSLRKYIPGSVACISCRSILLISKPKFWGPRIDRCECEAISLRTFREITLIFDCLCQALQKALTIYSNYTKSVTCLDINTAYDSNLGASGWDYQSCTEMVMPMCSTGPDSKNMFPKSDWDFNKFSNDCFEKFKVRPNKQMATTVYGGNHLEYAQPNYIRPIRLFQYSICKFSLQIRLEYCFQ